CHPTCHTELYSLSLPGALPILAQAYFELLALDVRLDIARNSTEAYQRTYNVFQDRFRFGTASRLETARAEGALGEAQATIPLLEDRKSTRLNSSHVSTSYAVFC